MLRTPRLSETADQHPKTTPRKTHAAAAERDARRGRARRRARVAPVRARRRGCRGARALARGERASSRPSRAQCAAAAVVAILGASAVTGASRSHLPSPGLAQRRASRRGRARGVRRGGHLSNRRRDSAPARRPRPPPTARRRPSEPSRFPRRTRRGARISRISRPRRALARWRPGLCWRCRRTRRSGTRTGSARCLSRHETCTRRTTTTVGSRTIDSLKTSSREAPTRADVAPGVPFDAFDDAYDAVGWAHAPARLVSDDNSDGATLGVSDESGSLSAAASAESAERERLGKEKEIPSLRTRRNAFSVCVDRARDWDVAFPEGWFQTFASGTLTPGYCVSEVILDESADESSWPCADADVVLFNEGAFIWQGAHRTSVVGDDGETREEYRPYLLKRSPEQVYVYFAHESPALFGSELLDRRFTDQFDYSASSNKRGASAWWNFAPSARHLVQDFVAFSRPTSRTERRPWPGSRSTAGTSDKESWEKSPNTRRCGRWGRARTTKTPRPTSPAAVRGATNSDGARNSALSSHPSLLRRKLGVIRGTPRRSPGWRSRAGPCRFITATASTKNTSPCYDADSNTAPCVLDVRDFPTAAALAERMREVARDERRVRAYARTLSGASSGPEDVAGRSEPRWPPRPRTSRASCRRLRGDGSGNKVKPALAQVAATGGLAGATAAAEAATGSTRGVRDAGGGDRFRFQNRKTTRTMPCAPPPRRSATGAPRPGAGPEAGRGAPRARERCRRRTAAPPPSTRNRGTTTYRRPGVALRPPVRGRRARGVFPASEGAALAHHTHDVRCFRSRALRVDVMRAQRPPVRRRYRVRTIA